MEQWDGTERRIGDGDRRKGQRVPFAEYPKMVNGAIVNSPDEEAELADDRDPLDDEDALEAARAVRARKKQTKAGRKK